MPSSRVTHRVKTIGMERVVVHGSFAPNGTSPLAAANTYGKGFSVARTGTGLFTVTMDSAYPALISGRASVQRPTGSLGTVIQLGTYDVTAKTVVLESFLQGTAQVRTLPLSITSFRERNSTAFPNVSDTPLTSDPDGFGGILAENTTPALVYNGTNYVPRLRWVASDVDRVTCHVPLPADLDTTEDITIQWRARMGGATDTTAIRTNSYFDNEGTPAVDDSAVVTGSTWAIYETTIASTDIPSGAMSVGMEIYPASSHTTDELEVSAARLKYTSLDTLGLVASDLSADANTRISFAFWFRNTSVDF